jgi:hypothetical protein
MGAAVNSCLSATRLPFLRRRYSDLETGHMNELNRRTARLLGAAALTLMLAACGDESGQKEAAEAVVAAPTEIGAPSISGTPIETTRAGDLYVFQPVATDPLNQAVTFNAEGLPAWASLDVETGRVTGTPTEEDVGETADIVVIASNGTADAELPAFRIDVTSKGAAAPSVAGSAAPVVSGAPSTTATAGTAWSFKPTATDADTLNLTFSITNKPAWASFSAATGALSGTPTAKQVGNYANIRIQVSDGSQQAALPAFSVQVVAPANAAPVISGNPATQVAVGSAYSFKAAASDLEKQALGFSITNKPSWATFNTATGTLTGTPAAANIGTASNIIISVTDGTSQVALPAFAITVAAAANGQPTISGVPGTTARAGVAYSFKPTAQDPNGDALTYSISSKPSWAEFSTTTGALSGTPGAGDQGSFNNVLISVSDGKSTVALASFNILVSATTLGSATLSWTPPTQNTDGTSLTNLSGYRIYYGTDPSSLASSIQITNGGLTSYTVGSLTPATYYFAIAAYTADGVEGAQSAVGRKTIM